MLHDIRHQILLLSVYIPLFWFIVILFSNLKKNPARFFILLLFFNITFVYFMTFFRYHEYFKVYANLFPFQAAAVLSSFPLFYLYVFSITNIKDSLTLRHLYHFVLPFTYGILFLVLMFLLMTNNERLLFIGDHLYTQQYDNTLFTIGYLLYRAGKYLYVLQSAFYLVLFVRIYKEHNKNVEERFPNTEGVDLAWLKTLGVFFLFVFVFNAIMHLLKLRTITSNDFLVTVSYSVFNMFFMAVGVLTFRQKEVYGIAANKFEFLQHDDPTYKLSKHKIIDYIENERPYLNKDFNIYDLCFQFNSNRTYISSFINQRFGLNFRTLINKYRIEDAKNLIKETLSSENPVSLDLIAIQVGFSSYSTFLRVFKQFENKTPFEYKDDLLR